MCNRCQQFLERCEGDDSASELGLRRVDQRTVAVRLPVGSRHRVFKGRGSFASDPTLGDLLHIACKDSSGPFEFLIREREWTGVVQEGGAFGCDFFIRLSPARLLNDRPARELH